jgi:hypothetical protein
VERAVRDTVERQRPNPQFVDLERLDLLPAFRVVVVACGCGAVKLGNSVIGDVGSVDDHRLFLVRFPIDQSVPVPVDPNGV